MRADADLPSARMLRPGDTLLRKLNPESWNKITLEVFPEAFEDNHKDLSLFVSRMTHPRKVLALFAKFGGLRDHYFGNRLPRTPEELWEKGFGIAAVSYEDIRSLGLKFITYEDGFEIEEDGHVEVINGKECMLELSTRARPFQRDDIF